MFVVQVGAAGHEGHWGLALLGVGLCSVYPGVSLASMALLSVVPVPVYALVWPH